MNTLLALLAISFGLSVVLTPVARRIALQLGLVDPPDQRRKLHPGPIAVSGGVAVFLAACGALALMLLSSTPFRQHLGEQSAGLWGLFWACLVISVVGFLDDCRAMRGRHKLLGQLVAVGIVMSSGVVVQQVHVFSWHIDLGLLALPFTAFWLLGAVNSLNLIDGMDGLLSCVGIIICLAMAVLGVWTGHWAAAAIACALAGALLGFLCFNFPPASIFLGDCGSMLVGLVVGVLAIQSSFKGPATVALAAPVVLLTIPIFDTLAAILRRKLTGRSIYATDRGHIHHCLSRYGLSGPGVLLLVSFLCLVTVVGMLASVALENEFLAVVAGLSVVVILVVGRLFGHAEFLLLKERLVQLLKSQTHGRRQGLIHQMSVRFQGSVNWAKLWQNLTAQAATLELRTVCLDVNAPAIQEGYHARWDRFQGNADAAAPWHAEFPLLVHNQHVGHLQITGERGEEAVGPKLTAIARWVEEIEEAVALRIPAPAPRVVRVPPAIPAGEPEPVCLELLANQVAS